MNKTVEKDVQKYIKIVRKFLNQKTNHDIPKEWTGALQMLENYYRQYCQATYEINKLDSLTVEGKYGEQPHPLLKIRDGASVRLEKLLSEFGLTMKSGTQLNLNTTIVEEDTPLEAFAKRMNKIEKR